MSFSARRLLGVIAAGLLSTGLCFADVNMGFVSFNVTSPPLGEFDISNQTRGQTPPLFRTRPFQ